MNFLFNTIGFNSLSDMVGSTISWKHKITTLYVLGFTLSSFIVGLNELLDVYVYSPSLGIFILFSVTILDTMLGLSAAIEGGVGIIPSKMGRAMIRFVTQVIFVGAFFQMHLTWDYIIMKWMVDSLLIIFTMSTFYSSIENAYKLNLITKEQFTIIEGLVNLKKLFERFIKK